MSSAPPRSCWCCSSTDRPRRGPAWSSCSWAFPCTSCGSRETDRLVDHAGGFFRESVGGQFVGPHPLHIVRVGAGYEVIASGTAEVVDDDEVILDAAIGRMVDAVEHFDDRSHFDCEACLLEHLARHGCLERLAELHATAGEAPFADERLVSAPGQQHPAPWIEHNGADADEGPIGKLPPFLTSSLPHFLTSSLPHFLTSSLLQIPMTLTTTRFFRWPSNSA